MEFQQPTADSLTAVLRRRTISNRRHQEVTPVAPVLENQINYGRRIEP